MAQSSLVAFGACAVLALGATARAQSPDPPNRFLHPEQVSPYLTSAGDATAVGLAVRWPIAARLAVQGEGEYRNGGRDLERYLPRSSGFNGNVVLVLDGPRLWRVTPFVVGGGGLEHHRAADWAPNPDLIDWSGHDSFVVNAGGGIRVAVTDRIGARIEVRYADGWAGGAVDSVRVMYGTTIGLGKSR
jgi:opacity protein-like surface antigen